MESAVLTRLVVAGDREDQDGVPARTEEQSQVPGAQDRGVHGQCLGVQVTGAGGWGASCSLLSVLLAEQVPLPHGKVTGHLSGPPEATRAPVWCTMEGQGLLRCVLQNVLRSLVIGTCLLTPVPLSLLLLESSENMMGTQSAVGGVVATKAKKKEGFLMVQTQWSVF